MDFDARFEYSEIISLKVQEGEDRFTLYPNPAKDQLTIVNGQGTGFISNFLGQAVQHFNVEENQKTIRIDNLKQGHYFLQIFQANGEKVSKIFVKK
jgi:ribosomal protein S6